MQNLRTSSNMQAAISQKAREDEKIIPRCIEFRCEKSGRAGELVFAKMQKKIWKPNSPGDMCYIFSNVKCRLVPPPLGYDLRAYLQTWVY